MSNYYLGIDIGASSGRHILAHMEEGKLVLEEVFRFPNGNKDAGSEKVWDVDELFENIIKGLCECKRLGKIPKTVGIDTWGVDFVLLDKEGKRIGNAVSYRDKRTTGMDKKVNEYISDEELYARTGIQKQLFNTIYQLMAIRETSPESLEKADSLLMIPDYFNFLLTGIKKQEYTNATTTELVNPSTNDWDFELIEKLSYPKHIFREIIKPGTVLGHFLPEISEKVGFDALVCAPATHDTGSAVMAVPTDSDDAVYISSGTWSLMGCELKKAGISDKGRKANFTNEGGFDYRYRFLKNIMGLWMIQSVRNEIAKDLSFGEICNGAKKADIDSLVLANDDRFLAPKSMTEEIKAACCETGQQVPENIYEFARVIYRSLAVCYKETIQEMEEITGKTYSSINIVGGGSNADYLNELTALETGKTVFAGPTEATAIGNIIAQMIASGEVKDLKTARKIVFDSFKVQIIGGQ